MLPRELTFGGPDIRFWTPLALTARQRSDEARHSNGWTSIGRLKAGATIDQVRAQLKVLDAANFKRMSPRLKPLLVNTGFYTWVEQLADAVVRDVRGPLSMLWSAAIVVRVIGLGNLGGPGLRTFTGAPGRARGRRWPSGPGGSTSSAIGQQTGLPRLVLT